MKLIDTHSHLLKETYKEDLKTIIDSSLEQLYEIWNISWDLETSKEVINLNKIYPKLLPVIGIHPNHTRNFSEEELKQLEVLIENNKIIAIGEIGLDFYRDFSPKQKQYEAFNAQLLLAKKYNLPVIIHSRNSLENVFSILSVQSKKTNFLIHSLDCDLLFVKELIKHENFYFSFNGIITFENSLLLQKVFLEIPKNKILLETDCPWLTPTPLRGTKNIPVNIKYIVEKISSLWKISFDETLKIVFENSQNFLKNNETN